MKLFQYDKKTWYNEELTRTWQFGIFKNRSLLWVNYENPSGQFWSSGGFHIILTFLSSSSLFGVEFYGNACLSFHFFTEYSEGWEE